MLILTVIASLFYHLHQTVTKKKTEPDFYYFFEIAMIADSIIILPFLLGVFGSTLKDVSPIIVTLSFIIIELICDASIPVFREKIFKLNSHRTSELTTLLHVIIISILATNIMIFRHNMTNAVQQNIYIFSDTHNPSDLNFMKKSIVTKLKEKQVSAEETITSQRYTSKLVSEIPTFDDETEIATYISEHLNQLRFNFTVSYKVNNYIVYAPESNTAGFSIEKTFSNLTYTEFLSQYKNLVGQVIKGTKTKNTYQINSWFMSHPVTYNTTEPVLTATELPVGKAFDTPIQVKDSVSSQLINRFENGELTSKTVKIPIQFTYQP